MWNNQFLSLFFWFWFSYHPGYFSKGFCQVGIEINSLGVINLPSVNIFYDKFFSWRLLCNLRALEPHKWRSTSWWPLLFAVFPSCFFFHFSPSFSPNFSSTHFLFGKKRPYFSFTLISIKKTWTVYPLEEFERFDSTMAVSYKNIMNVEVFLRICLHRYAVDIFHNFPGCHN